MRAFARNHGRPTAHEAGHRAGGDLLDRGWRYDAEVWFLDTFVLRGQIRQLRRKVLELAHVDAGAHLLDVGCGTGILALEAARLAGPHGRVAGIDPAPRQIARARSKARRAALDIDFRPAGIQELPFDDGSFDAVTSTLMMHHLPGDLKAKGMREMERVLKPGGRLVIADFEPSSDAGHSHDHADGAHSESAHLEGAHLEGAHPEGAHPDNAQPGSEDLTDLIAQAGLTLVSTERMPFARRHRGWAAATLTCATRPWSAVAAN